MITLPATIGRTNTTVGLICLRCHTIYSFVFLALYYIYPAGLIDCYLISVDAYASILCGACDHKVGPGTLAAGTYIPTSYQVTSTNNKKSMEQLANIRDNTAQDWKELDIKSPKSFYNVII